MRLEAIAKQAQSYAKSAHEWALAYGEELNRPAQLHQQWRAKDAAKDARIMLLGLLAEQSDTAE